MADVLSVGVNLEAFAQAISAIQALRSSVSRVFDCLKDGMRNKETLEGREKAFIAHFQDNLHSVNRDLNELERLSNLVGKPSENHPLHNSGLLSLDPVQDKTPLYSQLLQAYKWSNKLQYHAGLASGLLNQQSLKRSANQMGVSAKRRPKAQPTTLVLPPQRDSGPCKVYRSLVVHMCIPPCSSTQIKPRGHHFQNPHEGSSRVPSAASLPKFNSYSDFLEQLILPVLEIHINGITQYVIFYINCLHSTQYLLDSSRLLVLFCCCVVFLRVCHNYSTRWVVLY
nr:mediator of RNA polymerase II transcription subunit 27 isoform X2 [Globicephala melas]